MPLIIVTGTPSSGKTSRSLELKEFFEKEHMKNVFVVSDNEVISSINMDKNALCFDSAKEKEVRSIIKSSAQRLIGKEDIVILDAANYIKGYRYELYCMTKSSRTTQCTIYCHVSPEEAWSWNSNRPSLTCGDQPYSRESFDALVMRFEVPDSQNRWDSPLFIVYPNEEIPKENIASALLSRKPPPPNQSTQSAPLSATNYLHELDRITQDIAGAILSAQNSYLDGDVKIPGYPNLVVHMSGNRLTAAQLGRSRRQFLAYSKIHPPSNTSEMGQLFVHYLSTSLFN